ncbi:hypothetical protein [Kribbella speibonae]|nr:hypothetical protein [Kribbella speibonae]
MMLAVLITAGSIGLLVAAGWLADNLLRNHAQQWAKTLVSKDEHEES